MDINNLPNGTRILANEKNLLGYVLIIKDHDPPPAKAPYQASMAYGGYIHEVTGNSEKEVTKFMIKIIKGDLWNKCQKIDGTSTEW